MRRDETKKGGGSAKTRPDNQTIIDQNTRALTRGTVEVGWLQGIKRIDTPAGRGETGISIRGPRDKRRTPSRNTAYLKVPLRKGSP
jgi:hypothetical protein